jgi:hypothetical protein
MNSPVPDNLATVDSGSPEYLFRVAQLRYPCAHICSSR